jgi:carboxypeptidase Taq
MNKETVLMDKNLYASIVEKTREIKTLESALDVLTWDQETMMPPGGNAHRTEQKALLAGIIHDKKHDPSYAAQLETLYSSCSSDTSDESIIIQRLHKDIQQAKKLPTTYIQKLTRTTSQAFSAWQQAKNTNDWRLFEPHLKTLVELMQEKADYLGYKKHPLDALIDLYEPNITSEEISSLFSSLYKKLSNLLSKVRNSPLYNQTIIPIPSTQTENMELCKEIISLIGYDWHCGRIDTSEHPFSTAFHPTDSRITIRHTPGNLLDHLSSALHEAGHAMYELGLNQAYYGTALCEAASLGIHEGQSRFWETIIGQSKPFSHHLFRLIDDHYRSNNPISSPEILYNQINNVIPSLIRTRADEVSYPFHVILRFEIEKELIEGSLLVQDLPERWNEAIKTSLGVCPENFAEGCLQDVHWSMGSFGYFPTYTLGSLNAICFAKAMRRDLPHFDLLIQEGNFKPIRDWMSENVWQHGRRLYGSDLVTKILGRKPSENDYIEYLHEKYVR